MKRVVLYILAFMILSSAFGQRRTDDGRPPPFLIAGHLEILDGNNSVIAKLSEQMDDPATAMAAVRAVNPKVRVTTIDKLARSSADEVAFNMGTVEEAVKNGSYVVEPPPPGVLLPVSSRTKWARQICSAQCWVEALGFNLSKSGQIRVQFVGPDQGSLRVGMIIVGLAGAASTPSPRPGDTTTRGYYLTSDDAFIVYRVDSTDTIQMKKAK